MESPSILSWGDPVLVRRGSAIWFPAFLESKSEIMNKKDRQKVFDKYGGRCAYCGCELQKGWHVDHIEPIRRRRKFQYGYWMEIATKKKMSTREMNDLPETVDFKNTYKWVPDRWVTDGMENPELDCMANYMPSCASCNINKHGDSIEGFRQTIKGFVKSLNERMVQYKVAKRYGLISETDKEIVFYFELIKET